jgi:hypothetical protein
MAMTRIVGLLLLIVGAVLIIIGIGASNSVADNVSSFFTGHFTKNTSWYIFGGLGVAVVGLLLATGIVGRSRS